MFVYILSYLSLKFKNIDILNSAIGTGKDYTLSSFLKGKDVTWLTYLFQYCGNVSNAATAYLLGNRMSSYWLGASRQSVHH